MTLNWTPISHKMPCMVRSCSALLKSITRVLCRCFSHPSFDFPSQEEGKKEDSPVALTPFQLETNEKMASFETLIASLQDNSTSKLRLPLDFRSDIPRLLEALRANTSIQEVNLDIYETFTQRHEVLELFAALGTLPHLQRLWVDSGQGEGSPFYPLSVTALALVLQQAPQLQKLALYDVELVALNLEEWRQFEQAVAQRSSLQTFGLVGCRLAEESTMTLQAEEECFALAPLVGISLANLPNLQWFELTGQEFDSLGALTSNSLEQLCQSASLTKLTLDYFDLQDDHIAAMARALETSTSIEEWKITCELGRLGCTALAQLLFVNTSLNNFTLQLNELKNDNDASQAIETTHNTENNDNKKKPKNDPIYLVAQALERNQHLQYFCLCGYAKITLTSREAFATLLRRNTTLLNCEIELEGATLSTEMEQEADLMLRLNELGRKQLLEGTATPHQWVMTLWEMRRNLDGLFYLLSHNPMLCDLTANNDNNQAPERRPTYSGLSHLQFKYLLS